MSYEFKKLSEVQAMDVVPEGAKVLAEANGQIVRVPGSGLGGGTGSEIQKPLTYDYMPEGYPSKSIQHVVQMEEQQLTFIENQGLAQAQSPVVFNLSNFFSVIVEWDGVVYTCTVKEVNKTLIFGNLGLLGLEDTTNEPFLYFNGVWTASDTATSHTIKVTSTNHTYSTMSADFLPLVNSTTRGAIEVIKFDKNAVQAEQLEDAIGKLNAGQARVFWSGVEIIAGSCKTSGTIRILFANKPCAFYTFTATDGVYNSTLGEYMDRENTNLGVFSDLYLRTGSGDKIFKINIDDSGTLTATEMTN